MRWMDLFYGDQLQNQMPVMWRFLSYTNKVSKKRSFDATIHRYMSLLKQRMAQKNDRETKAFSVLYKM